MEIFDLNTTDVPIYDDILHGKRKRDYGVDIEFEIVQMTKDDYFQKCAEIHGGTVERELRMISESNLKELEEIILRGEKLPLPMLNYVNMGQEGRHRAILADKFNAPLYVMIIREK